MGSRIEVTDGATVQAVRAEGSTALIDMVLDPALAEAVGASATYVTVTVGVKDLSPWHIATTPTELGVLFVEPPS